MKRDSFIFYRSFMESLTCFDDQTRLTVYDAITQYALNEIEPELSGGALGIFKLIKPQIDANNRRFENGHKGGRPKNQTETKPKPKVNQTETEVKPNVNVNVNDNVNDNKKNIVGKPDFDSEIKQIIDYLNTQTQSQFKPKTEATRKSIIARLKEGYTVDDFKRVIDSKVKDWSDSSMREYLRPQTLFRPANFEAYLNEANRPDKKGKKNSFSDYPQNTYDFAELERKLIKN